MSTRPVRRGDISRAIAEKTPRGRVENQKFPIPARHNHGITDVRQDRLENFVHRREVDCWGMPLHELLRSSISADMANCQIQPALLRLAIVESRDCCGSGPRRDQSSVAQSTPFRPPESRATVEGCLWHPRLRLSTLGFRPE